MCMQTAMTYLQERLLSWLDEAWDEYCYCEESDFVLGKIYAYIECLEIILQSEGVDNDTLLALEEKYHIR